MGEQGLLHGKKRFMSLVLHVGTVACSSASVVWGGEDGTWSGIMRPFAEAQGRRATKNGRYPGAELSLADPLVGEWGQWGTVGPKKHGVSGWWRGREARRK